MKKEERWQRWKSKKKRNRGSQNRKFIIEREDQCTEGNSIKYKRGSEKRKRAMGEG